MTYYMLTDKIHYGTVIRVDDDNRQYHYCFGKDSWEETGYLMLYQWPESDLYEQYEEISEAEALSLLDEKKLYYITMREKALEIASKAHAEQRDKGGRPYINHPLSVAEKFAGVNSEREIVALLHDVIEDSDITIADLRKEGFDEMILSALSALTKKPGADYFVYLKGIKMIDAAKAVKLEDLKHNSDINRIGNPSEKDYARMQKYQKAIDYLMQ